MGPVEIAALEVEISAIRRGLDAPAQRPDLLVQVTVARRRGRQHEDGKGPRAQNAQSPLDAAADRHVHG
jgi:hypothetical protein